MKAVCNAGPLIALSKLGQLGLLSKLFEEVLISREVYREVVVIGLRLGATDAQAVDFLVQKSAIQVVDVTVPPDSPLLTFGIDLGEIETIVLGQQVKADWVLIDDLQARHAARREKLRIKGTMGLLLEALRKGFLSLQEIELLIRQVRSLPDLWVSEALCDAVLQQVRKEQSSKREPR